MNTAARVESRADGDQILISGDLKAKIESEGFPVEFLGSDFVKGKEQKIEFYLINWNEKSIEDIKRTWENKIQKGIKKEAFNVKKEHVIIRKNIDIQKKVNQMKSISKKGNPYLNRVMIPHPLICFLEKLLLQKEYSKEFLQKALNQFQLLVKEELENHLYLIF